VVQFNEGVTVSHNHSVAKSRTRQKAGVGAVVGLLAVVGMLLSMAAPAEAVRRVRRVGPDFNVVISPDNQRVVAGQRASFPIFIQAVRGFKAVPAFDIDLVPDYIDAEVSTVGLNRYRLDLIIPASAPSSNSVYKLLATSAKVTKVALFRLEVLGTAPITTIPPPTLPPVTQPPATIAPQFTISVDTTERTARTDETVQYAYTIDRTNYGGPVNFVLSNAPIGLRAGFSQNPSLSNTSVLLVTPAANTPSGRYVMTIVASAGTTQRVSAVVLNVRAAADFAFVVSPTTVSLSKPGTASYRVDLASPSAVKPVVNFELSGLPVGATGTYTSVSTDKSTTLQVTTTSATPGGTYPITITGRSGSFVHQATVTLVVTANPGFGIAADRTGIGVTRGVQNVFVVTVKPFGGFSGPVALTASGLPTGVTVTAAGSSGLSTTLNINADPATARVGTYRFNVTGTSGSIAATIILDLTIN
jgi:hypothetical protein